MRVEQPSPPTPQRQRQDLSSNISGSLDQSLHHALCRRRRPPPPTRLHPHPHDGWLCHHPHDEEWLCQHQVMEDAEDVDVEDVDVAAEEEEDVRHGPLHRHLRLKFSTRSVEGAISELHGIERIVSEFEQ